MKYSNINNKYLYKNTPASLIAEVDTVASSKPLAAQARTKQVRYYELKYTHD